MQGKIKLITFAIIVFILSSSSVIIAQNQYSYCGRANSFQPLQINYDPLWEIDCCGSCSWHYVGGDPVTTILSGSEAVSNVTWYRSPAGNLLTLVITFVDNYIGDVSIEYHVLRYLRNDFNGTFGCSPGNVSAYSETSVIHVNTSHQTITYFGLSPAPTTPLTGVPSVEFKSTYSIEVDLSAINGPGVLAPEFSWQINDPSTPPTTPPTPITWDFLAFPNGSNGQPLSYGGVASLDDNSDYKSASNIRSRLQAPNTPATIEYQVTVSNNNACGSAPTLSKTFVLDVNCSPTSTNIATGCSWDYTKCEVVCQPCSTYYSKATGVANTVVEGLMPESNCYCPNDQPYFIASNGSCRHTDPTLQYPCGGNTNAIANGLSSSCPYNAYGDDYVYQLNYTLNNVTHTLTPTYNNISGNYEIQIQPDVSYTLSIVQQTGAVYDYATDNLLVSKGGNALNQMYSAYSDEGSKQFVLGTNTIIFNSSSAPSIGRYVMEFTGVPSLNWMTCCKLVPLIIEVGGTDKTYSTVCPIELPQVLYTLGWASASDKADIDNFTWTIKSNTYITVRPGVTLTNGGQLQLIRPDLSSITPVSNTIDEPLINWQQVTLFDDYGNPIGQQRSYFDQKGSLMQSQVKDFNKQMRLASQQMEDGYGRKALQTLPVPIDTYTPLPATVESCGVTVGRLHIASTNEQIAQYFNFAYETNLMKTSSGTDYAHTDFDGTSKGNPTLLSTDNSQSKLGWYYSTSNTSASTVDYKEPNTPTTSYPYVQTVFYDDGTDRVKSVVAPGDVYRGGTNPAHVAVSDEIPLTIVNNSISDTYVSKYLHFYSQAISSNTINLANNLYQSKITDPNGIVNINYVDPSGKTLIQVAAYGTADEAVSYNLYDLQGRLNYTASPLAVSGYTYTSATDNNFSSVAKTVYSYDFIGNLVNVKDPERGETKFKYTRTGRLRFSENSDQRTVTTVSPQKRFSYTNYDPFNRPVESGEYTCSSCTFTFDNISASDIETNNALTGYTKGEMTLTYYDGSEGSGGGLDQSLVNGRVSSNSRQSGTTNTLQSQSYYSYDEQGRLKKMAINIPALGASSQKTIAYQYNEFGKVMEVAYQDGVVSEQFYHYYAYTPDGKLSAVYVGNTAPAYQFSSTASAKDINLGVITNLTDLTKVADYGYYNHGPLQTINYYQAGGGGANIQTLKYLYTAEGWLKAINHPVLNNNLTSQNSDRFALTLEYYDNDYTKNSVKSISPAGAFTSTANYYNGNIRAQTWMNKKVTEMGKMNAYAYDSKNQLTGVKYGTPDYTTGTGTFVATYNEGFGYDANGNLTKLSRTDVSGGTVYNFAGTDFTYSGNQLTGINTYGAWTFNTIGQATTAQLPNASSGTSMTYDPYGMIKRMSAGTSTLTYTYDDRGNRLSKTNAATTTTTDYNVYDAGGNLMCTYENTGTTTTPKNWFIYGASRIGTVMNGTSLSYDYEITDHLGTVRATIDASQPNSNLANGTDNGFEYYAYGSLRKSGGSTISTYPHQYQGQYSEKDQETGLNHFELRDYDPVTGRWLVTDPAGQFASPYLGMGNNPISGFDPSGGFESYGGAWLYRAFSGGDEIGRYSGGPKTGEYYVSNPHGIDGGVSAGHVTSWSNGASLQEGNIGFSANLRLGPFSASFGPEIAVGNSYNGLDGAARFKYNFGWNLDSKDFDINAKLSAGLKFANDPTIVTEAKFSGQGFFKTDANILGTGGEFKSALDPASGSRSYTVGVKLGIAAKIPLSQTMGLEGGFTGAAKFSDR